MICSTMGPGFFIFFRTCRQDSAGDGYPYNPVVFVHKAEKKLQKEIKKKVRIYRKKATVISKESINDITEALLEKWNPQPTIDKYQLEYEEALNRYRLYIEWYIQQLEDEELALMLIFANI